MFENFRLSVGTAGKIRHLKQAEHAECGPACVVMIAQFHGLKTDLDTLRRRIPTSSRGLSLRSLMGFADKLELSSRPLKVPLEDLDSLRLPAILHWDLNHYVVLERYRDGKALIHDPAASSRWISLRELSNHFTGVALELQPTSDFSVGERTERLRLTKLWSGHAGLKRSLVQALVLSFVVQITILAAPYFMQISIDKILPASDVDLLIVLAGGFAALVLFNAAASFLRSFVILWAGTHLGFKLAVDLARRLFQLPVSWFEKRHVGDVLSRFQSVVPIQDFLFNGAIVVIIDGVMALFTLVIMIYYSIWLTAVALSFFVLVIAVRLVLFLAERQAIEHTIVTKAVEQSNLIESLQGITTLRLLNRESYRHAFWQSKLTDSINSEVGLARVGIWQRTSVGLITGIEGIAVTFLAVLLVIDGGFSVGMIFAFVAYRGQFSEKASNLVEQFIKFRLLRLHVERLSDIALAEQDISFTQDQDKSFDLVGKLEIDQVSYRYSPDEPEVLSCVSFSVNPGEHVAITGPSGGGKSTLVKILLGLAEPTNGEFRVDGHTLERFGYKSYREQTSAVLQEEGLFAGSIAENIALFEDRIDEEKVRTAAIAAAIERDIEAMPLRYETLVGERGGALSGGQKQRILLARALYREPKLLVIDEGTAHLDSYHEKLVNQAIKNLGITRISIAHRQETLAIADRVLTLDREIAP